MTRKSVSLSVFLVAAWATQVAAQTAGVGGSTTSTLAGTGSTTPTSSGSSTTGGGNVQVQLNKVGNRDYPTPLNPMLPVGKQACDEGTITVTLSNLPNAAQFPYLEVWLQTSMSVECNSGKRNTAPITENTRCVKVPISSDDEQLKNKSYYTITVPLSDAVCGSSGNKTLYFLAMASQNNNDDALYYGKLSFKLDLDPPNAPTNVTGGTGETEIELSWDLPPTVLQYVWTLVDTTAVVGDLDGGTAECSSTKLIPGTHFDPADIPPEGVIRSKKTTLRSQEVFNGEGWGTEYAAAVVVAGDQAGNPSVLSEIGCLHVVKTSGFWDRYQENGGTADSGWGCSVSGPQGSHGSRRAAQTVLPAVFILGVWAARRRLRRRAR